MVALWLIAIETLESQFAEILYIKMGLVRARLRMYENISRTNDGGICHKSDNV